MYVGMTACMCIPYKNYGIELIRAGVVYPILIGYTALQSTAWLKGNPQMRDSHLRISHTHNWGSLPIGEIWNLFGDPHPKRNQNGHGHFGSSLGNQGLAKN